MKAGHVAGGASWTSALVPSTLGAFFAFLAGMLALKWLSNWLESDRWYLFGIYCLAAAVAVGLPAPHRILSERCDVEA